MNVLANLLNSLANARNKPSNTDTNNGQGIPSITINFNNGNEGNQGLRFVLERNNPLFNPNILAPMLPGLLSRLAALGNDNNPEATFQIDIPTFFIRRNNLPQTQDVENMPVNVAVPEDVVPQVKLDLRNRLTRLLKLRR